MLILSRFQHIPTDLFWKITRPELSKSASNQAKNRRCILIRGMSCIAFRRGGCASRIRTVVLKNCHERGRLHMARRGKPRGREYRKHGDACPAYERLSCPRRLKVIPHATQLCRRQRVRGRKRFRSRYRFRPRQRSNHKVNRLGNQLQTR